MDVVLNVTQKTYECIEIAQRYFGRTFALTGITFDLRGAAAGQLAFSRKLKTYRLRYNRMLLEVDPVVLIEQVVPHEVSHLVALQVYGHSIPQHGDEWKSVMVDVFGLQPDRCHTMDVSGVVAKPYIYGCLCGGEIKVTKRHHNKIQRSAGYTCTICKSKIMFTREEAVELISPVAERLLLSSVGAALTAQHLAKVKDMLGKTKVRSVVLHGDAARSQDASKLSTQLGVPTDCIFLHPRRESIPEKLTHALFFIDHPTERQLSAIDALRKQKALVRLVRHPTKLLSK
jgi:SprT protein